MKSLKALSLVVLVSLVAGCAASSDVTDLGNGFKRYFSRSGVELGDCGTQIVSDLFYAEPGTQERYVSSHSERGHALHCDLGVAIIDAGGRAGAAKIAADGAVKAAKALEASTTTVSQIGGGASSTSMSAAGATAVSVQEQTQIQVQQQTQSTKVKEITGGTHWEGGKAHGNNGKGNGGNDGSPNGKSDNGR